MINQVSQSRPAAGGLYDKKIFMTLVTFMTFVRNSIVA